MKHKWRRALAASILILLAILPGCRDASEPEATGPVRKSASSPQLVDGFREIIDKDLFGGATCSKDKVLKAELSPSDEEDDTKDYRVAMMDKYGEELLSFSCGLTLYRWSLSHMKTEFPI